MAFIPSYMIQDTIKLFYGEDPLADNIIEIYKPSSYGNEAIANNLRVRKSQPLKVGLAVNAMVSIAETKFREMIEVWNTEIDLRDYSEDITRSDTYLDRIIHISCRITNSEISKWIEEYCECDYSEDASKSMALAVVKSMSVNYSTIKDILYNLGYFVRSNVRVEVTEPSSGDAYEIEYEYSHIRQELDYYNGKTVDMDGTSAASLTNNKIDKYKKGLCNVFSLYTEFIQQMVNHNYDKELPDDIWNKYIIIRDDKFRQFIKSKINMIKFVDTWYYTTKTHINFFENNQDYLNEVRNANPDKGEILAEFSSNFGATVLIDFAINTGQSWYHSYKSFIKKNWKIFRLECLRKGISVRKHSRDNSFRTFFMMDNSIIDGSKVNTYYPCTYFTFRLKASLSDKLLCNKYGIDFKPMQLNSSDPLPKEEDQKHTKHEKGKNSKEDKQGLASYVGNAPIVIVTGKITDYENPEENVLYINKNDETEEWVLYIYSGGRWTRIYGVDQDQINPDDVKDTSIALYVPGPNEGNECIGSETKPMTPEMMALLRDVEGERRSGKIGDASKELDEIMNQETSEKSGSTGVSLKKEDYDLK